MGSDSDWPIMEEAAKTLELLGISYDADVVSAHRMPLEMVEFAQGAAAKGYKGLKEINAEAKAKAANLTSRRNQKTGF